MKNKIISAFGIGVILKWLSLFLSYRPLSNAYEDIYQPIATGGFPFKVFDYPVPPMGSNWPPLNAWPMFFLNLGIWILVGAVIAILLGKKTEDKKVVQTLVVSALVLTIIGLLYITLKFD